MSEEWLVDSSILANGDAQDEMRLRSTHPQRISKQICKAACFLPSSPVGLQDLSWVIFKSKTYENMGSGTDD